MESARVLCLIGLIGMTACSRSTTTLALRVTADGTPVAARVQLFTMDGNPLHIGTIDKYGARQAATACVLSSTAIGTWNGIIVAFGSVDVPVGKDRCSPSPAIPYGHYKVVAWHGIEFDRWEGEVDLESGRGTVELAIDLHRAWRPSPTQFAADMHLHAHESNDSEMPDVWRVMAQLAAGLRVSGVTNHNIPGSLADAIHALGADDKLASIPSVELTANPVHLGVYPVPLGRALPVDQIVKADPKQLFAIAHEFPDQPIVQLNHPRFRVTALFDELHWDGTRWPPPFERGFDAIEVLNGFTAFNLEGDRRIDDSVRDFYTLIDHGWLVAPVGNSDSHDFNWVHDGLARTYVDLGTQQFDQRAFVAAVRARRTIATTGPMLEVTAGRASGGKVHVDVAMHQANFVHCERIRITIGTPDGPRVAKQVAVDPKARDATWSGELEVGSADTWIGVTADGDTPMPIEQTGSYQRDKWKHPGNTPFALISPILVDADGDGRWKRGDSDIALP